MDLYHQPAKQILKDLKQQTENYWLIRGQKMVLGLFRQMASRVPAYKDFLKKNKIKPQQIKTIQDFANVPLLDKNNYLKQYSPAELSWDGVFKNRQWVISTTSGSTGEPFYFPRTDRQDNQYALTAELYLLTNFQIDKKNTLYIVGFPMGAWIGGLFTYQALKILNQRGKYNLSIITPGINKLEIINTVKKIGREFDQIIIGSYAPFLKDTLEEGIRQGLNWKKYKLGFIFSAEGFNEDFRDYILNLTGSKDIYRTTLNHYGTVDLGTMSYETPLSILLRRLALLNPHFYLSLFSRLDKLPTLTQFVPEMFYFESNNSDIICSGYSGYPLVRYDLHDYGGVFTLATADKKLTEQGINLNSYIKKYHLGDTLWNLPFVYVFERQDFSVSFFGFQIYPETIRKALWQKDLLKSITGKFTMMIRYDKNVDQYLELNIELLPQVKSSSKLVSRIKHVVVEQLKIDNSSYRRTAEEYPNRTIPKIIFWPYEHEKYFKLGTKQKWIKKNQ